MKLKLDKVEYDQGWSYILIADEDDLGREQEPVLQLERNHTDFGDWTLVVFEPPNLLTRAVEIPLPNMNGRQAKAHAIAFWADVEAVRQAERGRGSICRTAAAMAERDLKALRKRVSPEAFGFGQRTAWLQQARKGDAA